MNKQRNSINFMMSLFILCFTILNIVFISYMGAEIVIKENNDEINTMDDIIKFDRVIPVVYESSWLEKEIMVG